jgi:hypothetical protein
MLLLPIVNLFDSVDGVFKPGLLPFFEDFLLNDLFNSSTVIEGAVEVLSLECPLSRPLRKDCRIGANSLDDKDLSCLFLPLREELRLPLREETEGEFSGLVLA